MMKLSAACILSVCFSAACSGSDGANGADGANGVDGADGADGKNGEDGSSCHVTDNGDGSATIACDDGSEAVVSDGRDGTDGENGSNGADGEHGENGVDGDDAAATRISESYFCTGGLEDTALRFTYNAVLLSSGDLFVTGSVNGALNSATDTKYYAPNQTGYETASVSMRYDQDGTADYGWFSLSLNRGTLVTVIEYHESDPGPVAATWTMQPTDCVHNMY